MVGGIIRETGQAGKGQYPIVLAKSWEVGLLGIWDLPDSHMTIMRFTGLGRHDLKNPSISSKAIDEISPTQGRSKR
jgi:hypothetical protein